MFNPFILLYFIVIAFFLGGVAVVAYHLVKYQLNRKIMSLILWIFLGGSALLFLINLVIALSIDWSQYSITF